MSDSLWLHELHSEHQASPFFTIFLILLKLMSGVSEMLFNHHLILCHPFSSWPQYIPPIRVFSNESALASGGQSIGASASALVLPMTVQGWFPLGLTGLICLLSKGSSKFSSTTVWRHHFFGTQPSLCPNSHIGTWLLEKPQLWLYGPQSAKWCLCFFICCPGLS